MKNKILTVAFSMLFSISTLTSYANTNDIKSGVNQTYDNQSMDYYKKAREYYRSISQPDLEKSIELYDKGIQINKNNPYLYAGKAESLYFLYYYHSLRSESNINQAKLKYEVIRNAMYANDLNPNLPESHRAMSLSYIIQELYSQAREESQKALEMNKSDAESYFWLWFTSNNSDSKDKNIITASNLDPDSPLINLLWAMTHNRRNTSWNKDFQISLINKVIAQSPNNDMAYSILGDLHFASENYDSAIKDYDKALSINDDNPPALFSLGVIYKIKKTNWKAAEYLKKACSKNVTPACKMVKDNNY